MRVWLKDIRLAKHFTQSCLAQIVHISQNSYCNIENGKRRPSPEVAQRIASVLGFDWTLFYQDELSKGA